MTDETRRTVREPDHAARDRNSREDQSLGTLLSDVARDVSDLLRKEVELAKVELREEASKASKAGAKLGAAALMGHFTLLLASFAAAWGLAEVMPEGWAFLIVAVVYAIVAAVLYVNGRKQLREVSPMPRQTRETLKEDASWVREQMRLGTRSRARGKTSA
ncbi:phage holin family protein [Glycomyces sp. A-F 0318]|uniref:phage holin family protein n=1 Tax=Glycomyces amatae TaxID=2881355 RepID=UPI001E534B3F|nr:phage holin family protein [Glycomyces amatae]MCD0445358.1 phage holin family protein [Glycomyces amatae]